MILYTVDPKKLRRVRVGVVVTETNGMTVFKKPVQRQIHYFRNLRGYAIQRDVYDTIKDIVDLIEIIEGDTGDRYYADIDTWDKFGCDLDCGHGLQRGLPCANMWTKKNAQNPQKVAARA